MSTSAFARLRALLPQSPVIVGEVISHDAVNDTSVIRLPAQVSTVGYAAGLETGVTFQARGTTVPVGAFAFIRDGVVETRAPDSPPVEIVVGKVASAVPAPPAPPPVLARLVLAVGLNTGLDWSGKTYTDDTFATPSSPDITSGLLNIGSLGQELRLGGASGYSEVLGLWEYGTFGGASNDSGFVRPSTPVGNYTVEGVTGGYEYFYVPVTVVAAPPVATATLTLRTTSAALEYEASYGGASPTGASFDVAIVPSGASFVDALNAVFAAAGNQAAIGNQTMADGAPFFTYTWEVKVNSIPAGKTLVLGMHPVSEAFDPNTAYGGPASGWWASSGAAKSVGTGQTPFAAGTFAAGDVLGLRYDVYGGDCSFYKNGVAVSEFSGSGQDTRIFAGLLDTAPTV